MEKIIKSVLDNCDIVKASEFIKKEFNCNVNVVEYDEFLDNNWVGMFDGCTDSRTRSAKYVTDTRTLLFSYGLEKAKTRKRDYKEYSFNISNYTPIENTKLIVIVLEKDIKSNIEPTQITRECYFVDMRTVGWWNC